MDLADILKIVQNIEKNMNEFIKAQAKTEIAQGMYDASIRKYYGMLEEFSKHEHNVRTFLNLIDKSFSSPDMKINKKGLELLFALLDQFAEHGAHIDDNAGILKMVKEDSEIKETIEFFQEIKEMKKKIITTIILSLVGSSGLTGIIILVVMKIF